MMAHSNGFDQVSNMVRARIAMMMAHQSGFRAAQPVPGVHVWQQKIGRDTVMVMRPAANGFSHLYADPTAPVWAVLRQNSKGADVAEHEGLTLPEAVEIVRQMHLARKAA